MKKSFFSFSVWYSILLVLIVFFIPSNLFFKFAVNSAYVHGLLVDYLLPKIYLSDLPILALFLVWGVEVWKQKKKVRVPIFLVVLFLALFIRQFWTEKPLAAVWYFAKILEMGGLGIFLATHQELLQKRSLVFAWCSALLFQSVVAIYQFQTQTSVIGNFLFLGEVNFSHSIGLARQHFNGIEKILPYGTTSHPNVLGGFLTVGILLLILFVKRHMTLKKHAELFLIFPTIAISLFALYLTQSISAWLTLVVGSTIIFSFKRLKKIPVFSYASITIIFTSFFLMPFLIHAAGQKYPDNPSLFRRDQLNQAAVEMIKSQPLWGVGLNNFTANLETFNQNQEIVRFVQPAHNIGVLLLAETGFLGAILLLTLFFILFRKNKQLPITILCLLPAAVLDHYFITQQTGFLLLVFFLTEFLAGLT